MAPLQELEFMQMIPLHYSSKQTSDFFDRLEMTEELEEDLYYIVEWGEQWLVSFNATNTKLLSFDHPC